MTSQSPRNPALRYERCGILSSCEHMPRLPIRRAQGGLGRLPKRLPAADRGLFAAALRALERLWQKNAG
jgi:hypothetical protein